MNTYELGTLLHGSFDGGMTATTLYISIVSGYLVVAYAVGKELSRFQVTVITSLFVAFSVFFTIGTFQAFDIARELTQRYGSEIWFTNVPQDKMAFFIAGAEGLGIIGALVFMWDVRKDRSGK